MKPSHKKMMAACKVALESYRHAAERRANLEITWEQFCEVQRALGRVLAICRR